MFLISYTLWSLPFPHVLLLCVCVCSCIRFHAYIMHCVVTHGSVFRQRHSGRPHFCKPAHEFMFPPLRCHKPTTPLGQDTLSMDQYRRVKVKMLKQGYHFRGRNQTWWELCRHSCCIQ